MEHSAALEYVQEQAGEYLRVFATYKTREDYVIRYVRDDVRDQYSQVELEERVEEVNRSLCRTEALESKLGEQYAGLRLFPNVILIHIPPSEAKAGGLIMTLDREVGRNLVRFLESATMTWRDETPNR